MFEQLFKWPPEVHFAPWVVRLLVAALLGGVIGWQREKVHSIAGFRTHMLVSLGSALFILGGRESGMTPVELSRIFQGIAGGIGFLGAGVILKRADQNEVHGLTTAASVWVTAGVGCACATGAIWLPVAAAFLASFILGPLSRLENHRKEGERSNRP